MRQFQNSDAIIWACAAQRQDPVLPPRNDGRLEFTGEDTIDHTPKDERIRVFTGSAFDLTGERKRTVFLNDMGAEASTRVSKSRCATTEGAAEVRVVEHLYRGSLGIFRGHSDALTKTDTRRRWSSA